MRLTKKDERFGFYYNGREDEIEFDALNKLGQLEDIEDELGVDLVTLFTALKDGGVYVKNELTEDTEIKMRSFQICGDDNGITIWSQIKLNAKDYGKTWALTKEELL